MIYLCTLILLISSISKIKNKEIYQIALGFLSVIFIYKNNVLYFPVELDIYELIILSMLLVMNSLYLLTKLSLKLNAESDVGTLALWLSLWAIGLPDVFIICALIYLIRNQIFKSLSASVILFLVLTINYSNELPVFNAGLVICLCHILLLAKSLFMGKIQASIIYLYLLNLNLENHLLGFEAAIILTILYVLVILTQLISQKDRLILLSFIRKNHWLDRIYLKNKFKKRTESKITKTNRVSTISIKKNTQHQLKHGNKIPWYFSFALTSFLLCTYLVKYL